MTEITLWHWAGFILFVVVCIAVDMGRVQPARPRRHFSRSLRVDGGLVFTRDAIRRIARIFSVRPEKPRNSSPAISSNFRSRSTTSSSSRSSSPRSKSRRNSKNRVLVWGILGALVMRGAMIGVGAALIQNFSWVLYLFGIFLVATRRENVLRKTGRHRAGKKSRHPFRQKTVPQFHPRWTARNF